MSVSDPFLKSLKTHVYGLCVSEGPVTDNHESLQPFCQLLEVILRKGMKHNASSMLEITRLPRDYWQWIVALSGSEIGSHGRVRKLPLYDVVVQRCDTSPKVTSLQGRGRLFIREALQHRLLVNAIELLADNRGLMSSYYDRNLSILYDEILREIFKSLLMQINELTFSLCIRNHSFLDDTWKLPVFRELEFVPCRDLGLRLFHIDGRAIVTELTKGSVADDNVRRLKKRFYGQPVTVCVVKARNSDGSVFHPINDLLKSARMTLDWSEKPAESQSPLGRRPPHALLPYEIDDELPVHGVDQRASYDVQYVGHVRVGEDGGVNQVEPAILKLASESSTQTPMDVVLELGETEVIVRKPGSDDVVMKVCYTEVSSCGRKVDLGCYFSYIAGETTCSLAKDFSAHVFKAASENEAKTIICAIAQGFSRTHWFV